MYTVFIVDDEVVIREGIRNNFPWDESEFTLAGEAPDGEIALSMLRDIKPDILITDIRMPFMDGMQLCEAVNRTMPWIQMVILSGYDDFAYAKQAISLGVKEYMLKPVSVRELKDVLERIASQIESERRQQADIMSIKQKFASSSRILKERLLSEALFGGKDASRLIDGARELNFSLDAKKYLVMIAVLHGEGEALAVAQSALYRLADGSGDAVQACEATGCHALIVMGESDQDIEERAYGFAQSAIFEIERAHDAGAQIFIGGGVDELFELQQSFRAAQLVRHVAESLSGETLQKRRILGVNDVRLPQSEGLIKLDVPPLYDRLKFATMDEVDGILSDYVSSLGAAAIHSVMMANFLYVEILRAAAHIVREAGGEPRDVIGAEHWEQSLFSASVNPEEVLLAASDIIKSAIAFRNSQSGTRYDDTINKARAYLSREYTNSGVTLNNVASHVCMSNSHFCTIFSQEMGITFTEYLTGLRISKAKELLRTTKLRSSEIAYAVGYNDPHYFSYLFKKNVGVTPRDYRREAEATED